MEPPQLGIFSPSFLENVFLRPPQLLVTTKLLAPGHHCTPLTLAGTKGEGPSTPPYAPESSRPLALS